MSEVAHEILPNLWLGNRNAALDPMWLSQKQIRAVFNCTKDIPYYPTIQRRYRVPVDDNLQPEEIRNMELWAYELVHKMTLEYRTGQPILVHCAAGRQRSAAAIAMFLMASRNMTPDQAVQYIQERRPEAFRPQTNFRAALDGFYRTFQRDVAPSLALLS
jgi:rhodanese-related sulfurtransferase